MSPDPAAKPVRAGLSLYANLLDSSNDKDSTPGTISRAPVVFKQPQGDDAPQGAAAAEKQQISAASLRFQPTKRPQLSTQKPKPKPSVQKAPPQVSTAPAPAASPPDAASTAARPPAKTTLADWTADASENDMGEFYRGEKRQRGGKKKRKKNKEETHVVQNWDDIYDPSRPNNHEDYKHSDEKTMELREWKDKLYAHRMARRRSSDSRSDSGSGPRPQMQKLFGPPGLSFAPPASFENDPPPPRNPPQAIVTDDRTGEDAYARRMRLSLTGPNSHQPPPTSPPPPPPPAPDSADNPEPPPPSAPSSRPPPSISKEPVRYNLPPAPSEIPASETDLELALQTEQVDDSPSTDAAPRSLRPGQKGFAARLMSKYGWSKGSGLGASGSGIVNPLRVQVEKQKKKPDSEGGGFVGPGGMGKIVGGKRKGGAGADAEEGKFGAMSEVVILKGMVDGMDLDAEMEGARDGGLMQEIGEECGEKYGRVERVFIDRSNPAKAPVFVKFTSQLSALRAVNALEGRIFNGNTITARFYDTEKFESGSYE